MLRYILCQLQIRKLIVFPSIKKVNRPWKQAFINYSLHNISNYSIAKKGTTPYKTRHFLNWRQLQSLLLTVHIVRGGYIPQKAYRAGTIHKDSSPEHNDLLYKEANSHNGKPMGTTASTPQTWIKRRDPPTGMTLLKVGFSFCEVPYFWHLEVHVQR